MSDSGSGRKVALFQWAPALVGLSGAAVLAVGSHPRALHPVPVTPSPSATVFGPPEPARPRIYGPELPAEIALARQNLARQAGEAVSRKTGLPGRLGSIGPIQGPLSAELSPDRPVVGPSWDRNPLPGLPSLALPLGNEPRTRSTDRSGIAPARPVSNGPGAVAEGSSVIPDLTKLAVSQKANPTLEVRERVAKAAETTTDKPVSVSLDLGGTSEPRRAGEIVAVRMQASAAGYFVLLRIDGSGKASTVFRSTRPALRVACVLRAGVEPGAEYLLALAAVNPLNGEDVAAALRGLPMSFSAPAGAAGGLQPGAAWTALVQYAPNVAGAPDATTWQRHQWAVATAAFTTTASDVAASGGGKPVSAPAARETTAKPPAGKSPLAHPAPTHQSNAKPVPPNNEAGKREVGSSKETMPADSSSLPGPAGEKVGVDQPKE